METLDEKNLTLSQSCSYSGILTLKFQRREEKLIIVRSYLMLFFLSIVAAC